MTIGVFVSTLQPMLKNDGSINAAGVLHFYEPGQSGSTYKVVYSDYELTTSIGSQITLDSNGRKVIYLNGDYDLIEKDSAGTTIVSRSNINPDQSTTATSPNLISNGSFETNTSNLPTGWTLSEWNAGANVVDNSATNFADGTYSMKFVSTGSGGGSITTNSFFTVNEQSSYLVEFLIKSSVADVRNVVQLLWYDEAQVALGTASTSVYDDSATNPTSWTKKSVRTEAPSGARWGKLKIIGCDSSDATSGTVRYDGVTVIEEKDSIKLAGATPIILEGATANGFETSVTVTDPTADRTITIPDADVNLTGLVHLTGTETISGVKAFTGNNTHAGIETFNKEIVLGASTEVTTANSFQNVGGSGTYHIGGSQTFNFKSQGTTTGDRFKIYNTGGVTGCNGSGVEATGGAKGDGTCNFTEVYENGSRVYSDACDITSTTALTGLAGTEVTLAHGYGTIPSLAEAVLVCTTAEHGYSIGDEVRGFDLSNDSNNDGGSTVVVDATNVKFQVALASYNHKISSRTGGGIGAGANITLGNWSIKLRAWK